VNVLGSLLLIVGILGLCVMYPPLFFLLLILVGCGLWAKAVED
jgi:hypothetical protein